MSSLPLYSAAASELQNKSPKSIANGGNVGLFFNKFANSWKWPVSGMPEYDPQQPDAISWIAKFDGLKVGDRDQISEYARRNIDLVAKQNGHVFGLTNITRFVTGTGLSHPSNNGFAWHPVLGTPYMPGSGVKGMMSAYWAEEFEDRDEHKKVFGTAENASVGLFEFTDLIPCTTPKLAVEILTPHMSEYLKSKGEFAPGDWESPIPIQFLAVDKNQSWLVAVIPTKRFNKQTDGELFEKVKTKLVDAFPEMGAGAKTEIGMGSFAENQQVVDTLINQAARESTAQQLSDDWDANDPQVIELAGLAELATAKEDIQLSDDQKQKLRTSVLEFMENNQVNSNALSWIAGWCFSKKDKRYLLERKPDKIKSKPLKKIAAKILEQLD